MEALMLHKLLKVPGKMRGNNGFPLIFKQHRWQPVSNDEKSSEASRNVCAGVMRQKLELLPAKDRGGSGYPGCIKQQFCAGHGRQNTWSCLEPTCASSTDDEDTHHCAGVTRQKVDLLLPGDVDGSGYPGGVKQQFGAVRSMVEAILLQLKQLPDFQVLLTAQAQLMWAPHNLCIQCLLMKGPPMHWGIGQGQPHACWSSAVQEMPYVFDNCSACLLEQFSRSGAVCVGQLFLMPARAIH